MTSLGGRARWRAGMSAGVGTAGPELSRARRLALAGQAAQRAGLDALLLTPGPDLRYLTGYDSHPSERLTCLAVPAGGPAFLLVPRLELNSAQASPAGDTGLDIV